MTGEEERRFSIRDESPTNFTFRRWRGLPNSGRDNTSRVDDEDRLDLSRTYAVIPGSE